MKRIPYIDSIKGFAILLVVMGHTFHDFKGLNMAFVYFIYAFHMPLFFISISYIISRIIRENTFLSLISLGIKK